MTTKLSPTVHWDDEVDVTAVGFAEDAAFVHRVAGDWGHQVAGTGAPAALCRQPIPVRMSRSGQESSPTRAWCPIRRPSSLGSRSSSMRS